MAWQLCIYVMYAASISWRLLSPASYARQREPLVALLRLTSLGLGLAMTHVFDLVNSSALSPALAANSGSGTGASAAALQFARLLFASWALFPCHVCGLAPRAAQVGRRAGVA